MTAEEFVTSDVWMRESFERYRSETSERGLLVHEELDSRLQMRPEADLGRAIDGLLRFVLSTIPDGCEIFVASTRSTSPVAPLGAGTLTFRWQVTGHEPPPSEGNVRPLRPIAGGAKAHMGSKAARRIEEAFEGSSADLEFSVAEGDRELWARVTLAP